MPLKHVDIWRAIDRLAAQNGLSPSGLARKAGLSPTVFNPSKRYAKKRERWPSTESIARILRATRSDLDDFVALAATDAGNRQIALPVLDLKHASRKTAFTADGFPTAKGWKKLHFPENSIFALEINKNTRVLVSTDQKPHRGDYVAAQMLSGQIVLKRLGRVTARNIELFPMNRGAAAKLDRDKIKRIYRILWVSA